MDTKTKAAMEKIQGKVKPMPWWEPAKDSAIEKVTVQIAIPTYNNSLNIILDASLRQSLATTTLGEKLWTNMNFCGSDSLICRARDKLAGTFLESDAEWQLQIDDDIIFPYGLGPSLAQFYQNWMDPETFNLFLNEGVFKLALSMNAIDEILRSGIQDKKTIVGGLYFWRGGIKNFNQAASIVPSRSDGSFELDFKLRPDNYINTDRLATGFLLTHRSVYEDIQKGFPELEYDTPNNIPGKTSWAFYTPNITTENREVGKGGKETFKFYRSEDYAFAWRAKQVGHVPCLNMNILLGHLGTHIYSFFDRPTLQKLMFDLHNNPQHTIERIQHETPKMAGNNTGNTDADGSNTQQTTVVITKADGTTQLLEAYEDINLSSDEYPHYILFSQEGDVIEVHSRAEDIYQTWYFDQEPSVDELLDVLFMDEYHTWDEEDDKELEELKKLNEKIEEFLNGS